MVASNPSPPVSVGSEGDSTSLDPRADKERWWRSIDRLTHSQVRSLLPPELVSELQSNTTAAAQDQQPTQLDAVDDRLEKVTVDRCQVSSPATDCRRADSYGRRLLTTSAQGEDDLWIQSVEAEKDLPMQSVQVEKDPSIRMGNLVLPRKRLPRRPLT